MEADAGEATGLLLLLLSACFSCDVFPLPSLFLSPGRQAGRQREAALSFTTSRASLLRRVVFFLPLSAMNLPPAPFLPLDSERGAEPIWVSSHGIEGSCGCSGCRCPVSAVLSATPLSLSLSLSPAFLLSASLQPLLSLLE